MTPHHHPSHKTPWLNGGANAILLPDFDEISDEELAEIEKAANRAAAERLFEDEWQEGRIFL